MLPFLLAAADCHRRNRRERNDSNNQKMDAMIQKGLSMRGHNTYTQSSLRTHVFDEPGYSDCSAFCWKMYERFFGVYVGSWTGEQITRGNLVLKGSGGKVTSSQMAQFKKGDLLFYGVSKVSHVEMYIGNGQQLGHGSGMGPKLANTLEYRHSGGFAQARRYVTLDGGSSDTFTPKGTCTCTADGVRVRAAAWGSIIGNVNKGAILEYDGKKDGEFYHIRYNGMIGYVSGTYLSFGSSFNVKGTCKCTANGVRIRDAPNGNILTQVDKGTVMQYDGLKSGSWTHVKYGSVIGYMHSDYISY